MPDDPIPDPPVSAGEAALRALLARLVAAAGSATWPDGPPAVLRNEALPMRIDGAGVVILRDGVPGQPEILMSPLYYVYEHRAAVELVVQGDGSDREAAFDRLRVWLGQSLAADRTLDGAVDWLEAEAPAAVETAFEGGEALKAASVAVVLHYGSADPLI